MMYISQAERMKATAYLAGSKVTVRCKNCIMTCITPKTRGMRPNCKECKAAVVRFNQVVEYLRTLEPSGASGSLQMNGDNRGD